MAIRGQLPDPNRADKVLADPEKYFADARKRNREAIKREDAAARKRGHKPRFA